VLVRVHPPVSTEGYQTGQARQLAGVIETQVRGGVEQLQAAAQ